MRILSFGSLNIDHVYAVEHFVRPGESLSINSYTIFPGGKGANQATALARAGAEVAHAGKIGRDGAWYRDRLAQAGVDVTDVEIIDGPSGHAIIQVNSAGENAIIVYGGANQQVTASDAERVVAKFARGDFLLVQNEISSTADIIRRASRQGLQVVLNPAPMNPRIASLPLDLVDLFVVNEIEGAELTGESEPSRVLDAMLAKFPRAATVLTLGSKGAVYGRGAVRHQCAAHKVKAVDTTAAGDTFIGYFLAELAAGRDITTALATGCTAAAICVTRPGAASSIPSRAEVGAWKAPGA